MAPTRIPHTLIRFPAGRRGQLPDFSIFRTLRYCPGGLEIHRVPSGNVRYVLFAPTTQHLELLQTTVGESHRMLQFDPHFCPMEERMLPFNQHYPGLELSIIARAKLAADHRMPLKRSLSRDPADLFLRHLATLRGVELLVQVVFHPRDPAPEWAKLPSDPPTRYPALYYGTTKHAHEMFALFNDRLTETPYEVAIRALALGPSTGPPWREQVFYALKAWSDQFSEYGPLGNAWIWEDPLVTRRGRSAYGVRESLRAGLYNHDIFLGKGLRPDKRLRYVGSVDLAHLFSIPWKHHHGELDSSPGPQVPPPPPPAPPPGSPPTPTWVPAAPSWLSIGKHFGAPVLLPNPCHHAVVLGKTRSGKSSLLQGLAHQVLAHDPSSCVVVLDPHGGLAEGVRENLPREVRSRSVELDPSTNSYEDTVDQVRRVALPLNPLQVREPSGDGSLPPSQALQIALDDLVQTFKAVWGDEFVGPRVEHFLGLTVRALSEVPGTNMVDAYLVLTDPSARRRLSEKVTDPILREFLENDLPTYQRGPQREALLSTINKLGRVTSNPILREVLCQREGAVPFSRLLEGRLLLLNLSKGKIGTEASRFLGSVLLTQIWLSLLRHGSPQRPVYVFIDEVQSLAYPGLSTLLSEGAKYGLHLIVASQYLAQLPAEVALSLRANADAWMFYRVGPEDSRLAWELCQGDRVGLDPGALSIIKDHQGLLVAGAQLASFESFPPPPPPRDLEAIRAEIRGSTRRFGTEETSLDSPLLPAVSHLPAVLDAIEPSPLTRKELQSRLSLDSGELFRVLRSAQRAGLLVWDASQGTNAITELGRARLEATRMLRPGGTEGEEHSMLLARFAVYLKQRGGLLKLTRQKAGTRLPDGEYAGANHRYCVEAESTTVSTNPEQVRRNLLKAADQNACCTFLTADASRAAQLLGAVSSSGPRLALDREFIVLHWDGHGTFLRAPTGADAGPFLAGDSPGGMGADIGQPAPGEPTRAPSMDTQGMSAVSSEGAPPATEALVASARSETAQGTRPVGQPHALTSPRAVDFLS